MKPTTTELLRVRFNELPPQQKQPTDNPDSFLEPDVIAQSYLQVLQQHHSAWTWEVELRPWVERF